MNENTAPSTPHLSRFLTATTGMSPMLQSPIRKKYFPLTPLKESLLTETSVKRNKSLLDDPSSDDDNERENSNSSSIATISTSAIQYRPLVSVQLQPFMPRIHLQLGQVRLHQITVLPISIQSQDKLLLIPSNDWLHLTEQGFRMTHQKEAIASVLEMSDREAANLYSKQAVTSSLLHFVWRPSMTGPLKCTFHFKCGRGSFPVTLQGFAVPEKKQVVVKVKPLTEKFKSLTMTPPPIRQRLNLRGKQTQLRTKQLLFHPSATQIAAYDREWIKKQEVAFTTWLNFTLQNHSFSSLSFSTASASTQAWTPASATQHRIAMKQMDQALRYYQERIAPSLTRLRVALQSGQIQVKEQLDLQLDVGLREHFLSLITTTFAPEWIALGMAVLTGRYLSYQWTVLVKEFLKSHILEHALCLVIVLDQLKQAAILNTCLFLKSSSFKATSQVVLHLGQFVKGMGDFSKYLEHQFQIHVSYSQNTLEEFEYHVNHLATDLRDGIILAKVVEHLTGQEVVVKYPCASVTIQLANMQQIFRVLNCYDLPLKEEDIVQGHCEKTLLFLWFLIQKYQMNVACDSLLRDELSRLERNENNDWEIDATTYFKSDSLSLLLKWSQTVIYVASEGKIQVHNFTSHFADGKALCALLYFYHPEWIDKTLFEQEEESEQEEPENHNWTPKSWICSPPKPHHKISLPKWEKKARERHEHCQKALQRLGHCPLLQIALPIPDEKVVITLLSCVAVRVLSWQKEHVAARKIQRFYRKCWARKRLEREKQIKQRMNSIIRLQSCIRGYLRRKKSAVFRENIILVQSCIRRYLCRKDYLYSLNRIIQCQAMVKSWIQRNRFQKQRRAVIQCQLKWKLKYQLKKENFIQAVIRIQSFMRMAKDQLDFMKLKQVCVFLQRTRRATILKRYERMLLRQKRELMHQSAIKIQSFTRMILCRMKYRKLKECAVFLQKSIRIRNNIRKETEMRLRQERELMIQSAIKIQAFTRMILCRMKYRKLKECVVFLQKSLRIRNNIRKETEMRLLQERELMHQSAIKIQTFMRMILCRMKYQKLRQSIILLQKCIRARNRIKRETKIFKLNRERANQRRACAVLIQSVMKMYLQKKIYQKLRSMTIRMQSLWRGKQQRACYERERSLIILIQTLIKAKVARKKYLQLLESSLILQRWWRQNLKKSYRKKRLEHIHHATFIIRCSVRRYLNRKRMHLLAIQLQAFCRGKLTRHRFEILPRAVLAFQCLFRSYRVQLRQDKINRKLPMLRLRIRQANANAVHQPTLGHKTRQALDLLLKSTQLSSILTSLAHLDHVTQLSQKCRQLLIEAEVIPVLFKLISECNKSTPHMKILSHALRITNHLLEKSAKESEEWIKQGEIVLVTVVVQYREPEILAWVLSVLLYFKSNLVRTNVTLKLILLESGKQKEINGCFTCFRKEKNAKYGGGVITSNFTLNKMVLFLGLKVRFQPIMARHPEVMCCSFVFTMFTPFFNQATLSDIQFTFKDTDSCLYAHRVILAAASPTFYAMFTLPLKEGQVYHNGNRLQVPVACSYHVMDTIVRHCYQMQTSLVDSNVIPIYVEADYYQLTSLQEQCLIYIRQHLSMSTVLSWLNQSSECRSDVLQALCLAYLATQATTLFQREEWPHLDEEWVSLLLESDAIIATEEQILEAIHIWSRHQSPSVVKGVMQHCRLGRVSPQMLIQMEDKIAPSLLLEAYRFHAVAQRQVYEMTTADRDRLNANSTPLIGRPRAVQLFPFNGSETPHGIIEFLATRGHTASWLNPVLAKHVRIEFGDQKRHTFHLTIAQERQLYEAKLAIVSRTSQPGGTCSSPDEEPHFNFSFICQDSSLLLMLSPQPQGQLVIYPTHYTLRNTTTCYAPQYWVLEASQDGKNWIVLKRHEKDLSLTSTDVHVPMHHTWSIDPVYEETVTRDKEFLETVKNVQNNVQEDVVQKGIERFAGWVPHRPMAFSHFRIRQTAPMVPGRAACFHVSGFELYGHVSVR